MSRRVSQLKVVLADMNTRRSFLGWGSSVIASTSLGGAFAQEGFRDFYVDPNGDDNNTGLSPGAAWSSASKVDGYRFAPGDKVHFLRGATFYGTVGIARPGAGGGPMAEMSAYGQGSRLNLPKLSFYKSILPSAWVDQGGGIWRVEINNPASVTGNTRTGGAEGANIGKLKIDGVLKASKKGRLADLQADWDFYSDARQYLFVKSDRRPSERAAEILASPQGTVLRNQGSILYRDLEILGAGGHGAKWISQRTIDMKGCHIHEIGGSYLQGETRYGNGAEIWVNCRDINISNCLFGDVYDAATTMQGFPVTKPSDGWDNITIDDNWAYSCSQAFEVWARYGATPGAGVCPPGSGFRNTSSRRWTLFDIGRGPLSAERPSRASIAPFLIYGVECPEADIAVSVARMRNSGERFVAYPQYAGGKFPAGYVVEPSTIELQPGGEPVSGWGRVERQRTLRPRSGLLAGSTLVLKSEGTRMEAHDVVRLWAQS